MTKADYAEYRFESALAEEDDFDMLVMGRTQGKGCYCYVNGVLKTLLDKYIGAYRYVVIDNEAGMEHIARGTLPHVDALLLVSDCSRRGVQAVARIAEMVRELDLKPGLMKLIINRAPGGVRSTACARRSRPIIWSSPASSHRTMPSTKRTATASPARRSPMPARSSRRCTGSCRT